MSSTQKTIVQCDVKRMADGIRVVGSGCKPVAVRALPTCFEIERTDRPCRIGLLEFGALVRQVAIELRLESPRLDEIPPFLRRRRDPVDHRTREAIADVLRAPWRELVQEADPAAVGVQRAVFTATRGTSDLMISPALYCNRYLVNDIINLRAAAIAAGHIDQLGRETLSRRYRRSPQVQQARALAEQMSIQASFDVIVPSLSEQAALELLQDWPSLFAPDRPYTSLRKTLARLPGGVPARWLANLGRIQLPRPVYDRLELLLILLYLDQPNRANEHVVMHARHERIRAAIARVARYTPLRPVDLRFPKRLRPFIDYLAAYPERHNGSIIGLADKAIRWHREQHRKTLAIVADEFGPDAQTAQPPIALPQESGIQFLASPLQICEEGNRMRHCIATLIVEAMRGEVYLFHVEHQGESASVQVDACGQVVQASGPWNSSNQAVVWAWQMLARWGGGFPEDARRRAPIPGREHRMPF